MQATGRQLVESLLAAIADQDVALFRKIMSDDVTWWPPRVVASMGVARPIAGIDAVLRFVISKGRWRPGSTRWELVSCLSEADLSAVHAVRHSLTAAGTTYENDYVFIVRHPDGQISEVWEHLDTAHAESLLASGTRPA